MSVRSCKEMELPCGGARVNDFEHRLQTLSPPQFVGLLSVRITLHRLNLPNDSAHIAVPHESHVVPVMVDLPRQWKCRFK